jgi:hypothetical protein
MVLKRRQTVAFGFMKKLANHKACVSSCTRQQCVSLFSIKMKLKPDLSV